MRTQIRRVLPNGFVPTGRSLVRALSALAAVALAAFHVDLLVKRFENGSLLDPWVAVQWLGAGALIAVAIVFVRRQISLGSGRKALAFWLLVLVLHALPGAPVALDAAPTLAPPPLVLLVPVVLLALSVASALIGTGTPLRMAPVVRRRRSMASPPRPRPGIARTSTSRGPPS